MKKILILAFVVILTLSLAACGAKDAVQDTVKDAMGGNSGGSAAPSGGGDAGLTQKDIDDANEAWDILENVFYAEDWRWDKEDGSGYINGKWDEGVMYDPVPAPPEGIQVTEMQYVGKKSQKWSETGTIGDMDIDSSDYEFISVDFDCSKAQLEEMVKSYTDAGWLMSFEEDYGNGDMWHFYYGGDYYAYLRASDFAAADGYDFGAYLTVTPAYYALPESVGGVKAPQCGILLHQGWITGYDKDYNMVEEEPPLDTPVGSLPAKWIFEGGDYCNVSADDVKAYRDTMVADGWEITNEYEGEGSYTIALKKGELTIRCSSSENSMDIQIANDDNLYG